MTTSEGFRILGDDPSNQQSCLLDLDLKGATRIPKPKEKPSSPFSCNDELQSFLISHSFYNYQTRVN